MMYDTHAHLDFPEFSTELGEVIQRAEAAGVDRIITVGTSAESSLRALEIAKGYPGVFASVGWHPSDVSSAPAKVRPLLRELATQPKVVAIGETGLDYSRLPAGAEGENLKVRQKEIFLEQLELAKELKLNVIIHQRESFKDTLELIRPYASSLSAVFHCFSGTVEEMQEVLASGFVVSFTGIVTFKNAQALRETVEATPLEKFMLETDCPFLAPVPFRGKRCEPAHVVHTAQTIADLKKITVQEVGMATSQTADQFFFRRS